MIATSSSRAGRKPRFDAKRRALYIEALARTGVIGEAMAAAGVASRATIKTARDRDTEFADAERDALEAAADQVEALVRMRSEFGHEVPVLDVEGNAVVDPTTGRPKTAFIPPNDKFLLARLRALKPERYGTERVEHTGGGGVLIVPAAESAERFEEMLEKHRLAAAQR